MSHTIHPPKIIHESWTHYKAFIRKHGEIYSKPQSKKKKKKFLMQKTLIKFFKLINSS